METTITKGIRISVEVAHQPSFYEEVANIHVFTYRIIIENHNNFTVQLLRRHWHIVSSDGARREVEGEGVIGKQPILKPHERHEYYSHCHLPTPMGKMFGTYLMMNVDSGEQFIAEIPEFKMAVPFVLN